MSLIEQSIEFDRHLLSIPLNECHEVPVSLVDLASQMGTKVSFADGLNKTYFLRESVALSVVKASLALLEEGYILKIEDAYRNLDEQKHKFLDMVKEIRFKHTHLSEDEIRQVANIYVAGVPILAAHTAGAAVDVTLLDKDLKLVGMGCPYLYSGEESTTDYQNLPKKVLLVRKKLCQIMEQQGLINYPFEYWHFSQGDVGAAYMLGQRSAVYGPVDFNTSTLKLEFMNPKDYHQYFYT